MITKKQIMILRYLEKNKDKKVYQEMMMREGMMYSRYLMKCVSALVEHGYIKTLMQGPIKYLELTDKGNKMLKILDEFDDVVIRKVAK